jgi:D-alanyl-D-alanine carboxypeptidase/D-alanyl-D-alanine-endopeptidase (penicillin-binding protein 4)
VTMGTVRRALLALLVAGLALTAAGSAVGRPAQAPLAQRLARALAVPHVPPATTAAVAFDLSTGREVFARNRALALAPASTEKLPVAFAALFSLGPEFRIETDVLGNGELAGATWKGSLVLQGHGDPTLSSNDLAALATQLRAMGIRRVTGGVVGDESFFDTRRTVAGWKASFYIEESPPLSALVVDRAKVGGFTSRNPALSAATEFRAALRRVGIAVVGRASVGRRPTADFPLAFVHSPTVAALVRFMGLESDNFTAEMLLKQLGAVEAGRGSSAAGAAVVTRIMRAARVPLAGVRIVDGSGLSHLNRLTAGALVGILHAAWIEPEVKMPLLRSLPVAGRSGTLEKRLRRPPALGNVAAKTGTTSQASALSGYVRGRFVFAVIQNGRPVSSWWARKAQDRFVMVLAAP